MTKEELKVCLQWTGYQYTSDFDEASVNIKRMKMTLTLRWRAIVFDNEGISTRDFKTLDLCLDYVAEWLSRRGY